MSEQLLPTTLAVQDRARIQMPLGEQDLILESQSIIEEQREAFQSFLLGLSAIEFIAKSNYEHIHTKGDSLEDQDSAYSPQEAKGIKQIVNDLVHLGSILFAQNENSEESITDEDQENVYINAVQSDRRESIKDSEAARNASKHMMETVTSLLDAQKIEDLISTISNRTQQISEEDLKQREMLYRLMEHEIKSPLTALIMSQQMVQKKIVQSREGISFENSYTGDISHNKHKVNFYWRRLSFELRKILKVFEEPFKKDKRKVEDWCVTIWNISDVMEVKPEVVFLSSESTLAERVAFYDPWMELFIQNCIKNSQRAKRPEKELIVKLSLRVENNQFYVDIEDNGTGFEDENMEFDGSGGYRKDLVKSNKASKRIAMTRIAKVVREKYMGDITHSNIRDEDGKVQGAHVVLALPLVYEPHERSDESGETLEDLRAA